MAIADDDRQLWSCGRFNPSASQDMLDIARRAGAAFPNMPLLGLDLLRCNETDEVYVLEINAGGNVWHYSSPYAAAHRAAYPETYPTEAQKQWSFEKAAEILIQKALTAAK
jgi:D-alanine-D-alanine ligase-like ATP-grasp enzyme